MPRVVVRAPSPRLADGELTHQSRSPVDVAAAVEQHGRYVGLLRELGYKTIVLPELVDHPDGVFVEDTLVVIGASIVVTKPGAPSRRGEIESLQPVLAELGVPIDRLSGSATLDGGDVLVTDQHVFVGLSTRTNASALDQLGPIARREGRVAIGVPVTECLHLKTAITELSDGSLVAGAGLVDVELFRALGYPVDVTDEPTGANVLRLGTVNVVSTDAPRTAERLARRGLDVRTVDIGEFHKVEAGLTCMCVLIDGHGPHNE